MVFDIGIIGCGIAGTFAALKVVEKYKDCKCIIYDIGRPPQKRRRQLEGFLGCFPTGNGRIYPNNLNYLKDLMDGRKVMPTSRWVKRYFKAVNPMKLVKDSTPLKSMQKTIENNGFDLETNDYYQWKPDSVHKLSKLISEQFYYTDNLQFSFDTIVNSIEKNTNSFTIHSERGSLECKNVILAVGRSGWRWATNLYKKFGMVVDDDWSIYGVRAELPAKCLKSFKKSHCRFYNDDLDIGPIHWEGSVIPEDHSDLVISAFRSNEDRWKSEKASISILKKVYNPNEGCAQSDRIGKLSFLLFNDRVSREKVKHFLKGHGVLSMLPEYEWLKSDMEKLNEMLPGLCSKGYIYAPHILPLPPRVRLGSNLESEVEGLYLVGECARIPGIFGAAVSGAIAVNNICG
jgi:hypothetical protein